MLETNQRKAHKQGVYELNLMPLREGYSQFLSRPLERESMLICTIVLIFYAPNREAVHSVGIGIWVDIAREEAQATCVVIMD